MVIIISIIQNTQQTRAEIHVHVCVVRVNTSDWADLSQRFHRSCSVSGPRTSQWCVLSSSGRTGRSQVPEQSLYECSPTTSWRRSLRELRCTFHCPREQLGEAEPGERQEHKNRSTRVHKVCLQTVIIHLKKKFFWGIKNVFSIIRCYIC